MAFGPARLPQSAPQRVAKLDFDNEEEDFFDRWENNQEEDEGPPQDCWLDEPTEDWDQAEHDEGQSEGWQKEQGSGQQTGPNGGTFSLDLREKARKTVNPFAVSKFIVESATKDLAKGERQSYWNRGIVPKVALVKEDFPNANTYDVGLQSWDQEPGKPIKVYVDGSGFHSDPRLRRCGWGVAWLNQQGPQVNKFRGGRFGGLGDEIHSVAKAELEALIVALRTVPWQGVGLIVYSDCKFVVQGVRGKIWNREGRISHRQRWEEVRRLLQDTEDVKVVWVKAHITPVMQEHRRVPQDLLNGNEAADALAKRGAKTVQLTKGTKERITRLEITAWKVRRRLLAIQMYMLENHGEDREDKVARKKAQQTRKSAEKRKKQEDQKPGTEDQDSKRQKAKCQEKVDGRRWPEVPEEKAVQAHSNEGYEQNAGHTEFDNGNLDNCQRQGKRGRGGGDAHVVGKAESDTKAPQGPEDWRTKILQSWKKAKHRAEQSGVQEVPPQKRKNGSLSESLGDHDGEMTNVSFQHSGEHCAVKRTCPASFFPFLEKARGLYEQPVLVLEKELSLCGMTNTACTGASPLMKTTTSTGASQSVMLLVGLAMCRKAQRGCKIERRPKGKMEGKIVRLAVSPVLI